MHMTRTTTQQHNGSPHTRARSRTTHNTDSWERGAFNKPRPALPSVDRESHSGRREHTVLSQSPLLCFFPKHREAGASSSSSKQHVKTLPPGLAPEQGPYLRAGASIQSNYLLHPSKMSSGSIHSVHPLSTNTPNPKQKQKKHERTHRTNTNLRCAWRSRSFPCTRCTRRRT